MAEDTKKGVRYKLDLDTDKSQDLRKGKQVFTDGGSHRWYLTADEVKELGKPTSVTVTIEAN